MSNFRTSTQLKHWKFESQDELIKMREKKMKRIMVKLKKAWEEFNKKEHDKIQQGHKPSYIDIKDNMIGKQLLITWKEEIKFINWLISYIVRIWDHMKFPTDVRNTSIEYLKRFYLKQSVYDFDPVDMMYTAIFLAVKVEETNYKLSDFARVNQISSVDKIVQSEAFLIKGLKFEFFVYSPYRWFNGFHDILRDNADSIGINGLADKLDSINEIGTKAIKHLHYWDVNFLATPAQIGFAALWFAFERETQLSLKNNDAIASIFQGLNLFDYGFWDKNQTSKEKDHVDYVMTMIVKVYDKDPNINEIKTYK